MFQPSKSQITSLKLCIVAPYLLCLKFIKSNTPSRVYLMLFLALFSILITVSEFWKFFWFLFGRHCVAAMSNKDAVNWNSMYSFFKIEVLFFGFTVTSPITLSFGKLGKGRFHIEWADFLNRHLLNWMWLSSKKIYQPFHCLRRRPQYRNY
jgi:hypothetical protein